MVLIDLIYPKKCLTCGREGKYICGWCLKKVPINYSSHLLGNIFYRETYLWHYTGVIRKAILTLKYKFARRVGLELAQRAIVEMKKRKITFPKNAVFIPVPSFPLRENWRGFNQTNLIGKYLAQKLKTDFEPNLIVKTKNTNPQTELSKTKRKSNLKGVFNLNSNIYPDYQGRDVVLFDDILTTGTTVWEIAGLLHKAKLKNIYLLILAKR